MTTPSSPDLEGLRERLEGETDRLVHENALAARMYPVQWASMERLTGKRRSSRRATLRKRAVAEVRMAELRNSGSSCATCEHFRKASFGEGGKGHVCDLYSDSEGYVRANPDGICPDYSALLSALEAETNPEGDA
jgi:hypothetical protein